MTREETYTGKGLGKKAGNPEDRTRPDRQRRAQDRDGKGPRPLPSPTLLGDRPRTPARGWHSPGTAGPRTDTDLRGKPRARPGRASPAGAETQRPTPVPTA